MKKHFNLPLIVVGGLLFTSVSCKRDNCDGFTCNNTPNPVLIELRDNEGHDLLNPATPGHYDSLEIAQLNEGTVGIIPPSTAFANPTKYKLAILSNPGEKTTLIRLSATDADTVYTNDVAKTYDCCTNYELSMFRYNNTEFYDNLFYRLFVVRKQDDK